ncbi:MAG: caspase family protein [Bacteroidia bacterium]|nr:caspase family protein [Bacteroidia bacterium]
MTAPRLFVLLTGINQYPSPVPSLSGCVNDVRTVADFLRDTYPDPAILSLLDGDATRQNVIDGFRKHLAQAGKGDSVYFHYSGHGSRENAPVEFHRFVPDRKNETLVLADSRKPGGLDLADKELAVLIKEVADRGATVTVVVDACHSGSITRNADDFRLGATRQAEKSGNERGLDDYLDGYYTRMNRDEGRLYIPVSRHIVLSGCEKTQVAHETQDRSGVFTASLMKVLGQTGGNVSYADLFQKARIAIRQWSFLQNPQFETVERFDAYSQFITGSAAGQARRRQKVYLMGQGWRMDYGALHGLPADLSREISLDLYDPARPDVKLGSARVQGVLPQRSELDVKLDNSDTSVVELEGQFTSLPSVAMDIYLYGADDAQQILKDVAALHPDFPAVWTSTPNSAWHVEVNAGSAFWGARLFHAASGLTVRSVSAEHAEAATDACNHLLELIETLSNWSRVERLQNPATRINPDEIELVFSEITPGGELEHTGPDCTIEVLPVTRPDGSIRWLKDFRLMVRNKSQQHLFFSIFYLKPTLGIEVFHNGVFDLKPGAHIEVIKSKANIADSAGDEAMDLLRMVVSTDKVDDFLLVQKDVPEFGGHISFPLRSNTKGLIFDEDESVAVAKEDWLVKHLNIKLVKHRAAVSDRPVEMDGGIVIAGHPALRASISLQAAETGTRSDSASVIPQLLSAAGAQVVSFGHTRSAVAPNMIELRDIQEASAVTPETPLRISLRTQLGPDEGLMAAAFDGEYLLPVGLFAGTDGEMAHVEISHIPEEASRTRSLNRALKLVFFKNVMAKPDKDLYLVREAHVEGEKVVYSPVTKEQVAAASRILLVVHGIIGNTEQIVRCTEPLRKSGAYPEGYDLVLAYDYECLNTPIRDIARKFKEQLAVVGIQAGIKTGDRPVHIDMVAHSMGGLVTRWMIEREGGHQFISRVLLCGVPNQGSGLAELASWRDTAITFLSYAMNVPFLKIYLSWTQGLVEALRFTQQLTRSLEDMHPERSTFLQELNAQPEPQIPYILLTGSLMKVEDSRRNWLDQLRVRVIRKGASWFLDGEHDMAVTVKSGRAEGVTLSAADRQDTVPCLHVEYFVDGADQKYICDLLKTQ